MAWILSVDRDDPTTARDFLSTGSTLLDYVISNRRNGGVPVGKITEIAGLEASGKSLVCAHLIVNAQRKGGVVVLIDTENAFNPQFAQQVGVDLDRVLYLQPGTVENCFEAVESCIKSVRDKNSDAPFLIIWDSVAATPPQAEIEGDYDPNSRIGLMAKAMSKGMRKLTNTIGKDKVTLVFTNQLKMAPGVMYGDPYFTPGGKAIPYHASVRVRLTSSTKLKDASGEVFAIKTNAKCMKTRLGPPLRTTTFQIRFDSGVDDIGSIRDYLHEKKEIEKAAGYMKMRDVPTKDGVVPELKFRESEWRGIFEGDEKFREHVLSLVERRAVVTYGATPREVEGETHEEEFESDE